MKPDGVAMASEEYTEIAAVAEPSVTEGNLTQEAPAQPDAAAGTAAASAVPKAKSKPVSAEPKGKPKTAESRSHHTTSAGNSETSSRLGTNSHRTKDVKAGASGVTKTAAATFKPTSVTVPKRHVGVAMASAASKSQVRLPDKKPAAPARTASAQASTAANGARPTTVNGTVPKRPAAGAVGGARPKSAAAATSRTTTSAAPKPVPSTTAKPAAAAASKTTRPATGPSTSLTTSKSSRPNTATANLTTTHTTTTAAFKGATAPSTGRSVAAQPKSATTAATKKDVGRSTAPPAAKKLPANAALPAAKKPEVSKPGVNAKPSTVAKSRTLGKAADSKPLPPKSQQPAKPALTKKPVGAARFPQTNKPAHALTPPASPANKTTKAATPNAKRGAKPTLSVQPFGATKQTNAPRSDPAPAEQPQASGDAVSAAPAVPAAPAKDAATVQHPVPAPPSSEQDSANLLTPDPKTGFETPEISQSSEAAVSVLSVQRDEPAAVLPPPEQISSAGPSADAPSPSETAEKTASSADKAPSTSSPQNPASHSTPQKSSPANLNEDEDDEEREGSQLVSVSEMSGTTQPTEESRPGSGALMGASAWRAGGALLSEFDSEEVSGSQQGASELSAPGVLEGTESMDDLGDGSLKEAIDMEGASAGSPDFEKVPDIPTNDFDEDEDDSDRVCDMDVGSEKTDEPRRLRHDNEAEEDEEDEDVEMASEGVTESGLESYGNADEDDFADDERLDNLNRVAPPSPPQPPSAPAAQWDQPNPFADPWAEPGRVLQAPQEDLQNPIRVEQGSAVPEEQDVSKATPPREPQHVQAPAPLLTPDLPLSAILDREGSAPEKPSDLRTSGACAAPAPEELRSKKEVEEETSPADELLGVPVTAPTSNPSSTSASEDEASDTEGEAQLDDAIESISVTNLTIISQSPAHRLLSTVEETEEGEEAGSGVAEDTTPPSADSLASYGFDSTLTTASNSNAQSTGESCIKSPGIFSLEELPEEAKELSITAEQCEAEQLYSDLQPAEHVGKEMSASGDGPDQLSALGSEQQPEENPEDSQSAYICEKTEDSFQGFSTALQPQRRDHSAYPRAYYDIVKLPGAAVVTPPKLTCADLPPRSPGKQGVSPQLRRLEQHHRQLLELQQRREQQSRPLEEAEQERKRRVEEEERRKKEEAEEEIKRNKEEAERRRELELQLQQQQEELRQRQQQSMLVGTGQGGLLSPSSGLCTIYEALESSDEETNGLDGGEGEESGHSLRDKPKLRKDQLYAAHPSSSPAQKPDFCPGNSPNPPEAPLDLDWGKKVDIVQHLINQTLLLNGDACSSLLLLPGGSGGTLSPLETSLWPTLLPPLTPPSATVTSVSSFSPDATGSSPQGEWTVVELETHH